VGFDALWRIFNGFLVFSLPFVPWLFLRDNPVDNPVGKGASPYDPRAWA
jgi:hypothetical protein